MRYSIERVCWCDKTYNGFTDNPYWLIRFEGKEFTLSDDGILMNTNNYAVTDHDKVYVNNIITECKLTITLA